MKWVEARDLDLWAGSYNARIKLSELISRLVRASVRDMTSFRFPSGDSVATPGYDGQLECSGAPPYIPFGLSVWELGTGEDYIEKANEDFCKRSEKPGAVDPANRTFVFVTARRWDSRKVPLTGWTQEKKSNGPWKDVQAIDAIQLEDWLERCPPVAAWAARYVLGKQPPSGTRSSDEFWEEYASRFKPPLTGSVLLCGREKQAQTLIQQLSGPAQPLLYVADSPDEVVGFVAAAIRGAEDSVRKFLDARTLILDTEDAARIFASTENAIFVARGTAGPLAGLLGNHNPTIVASGRDVRNRPATITLERPSNFSLAQALLQMGIDQQRAEQLARECGRSVTILARRIPSATAEPPQWDGRTDLIPALLAGGWDCSSEDHQEAVAELAGVGRYADFEDRLLPFLRMQDPAIEREGNVWHIRAPVDAFVHLGSLVGRQHMERLRSVALRVFSEYDPALDLPPEERAYAGLRGVRIKYSPWLRDGLATSVLLIAALHEEADLVVPDGGPQRFVDELVQQLPGLSKDWRLLGSLNRGLPLLMEASPGPFLAALDRMVEGEGTAILPLFREDEALFGSAPHTYLLWALETVAWDPSFLTRSVLILAKLARLDPGGRLQNRPINSLQSIFLPWYPCTNAGLTERIAALDQVIASEPEVGWRLIVALMPARFGSTSPTPRPKYREAGASERETLTRGAAAEMYRQVVRRALRLVGNDPQRWITIIGFMPAFEPPELTAACDGLERFAAVAGPQERVRGWSGLRAEINRQQVFSNREWILPPSVTERLRALQERLRPEDRITNLKWLFESHFIELPAQEGVAPWDLADRARQDAVRELYRAEGNAGVLSLAAAVAQPALVGAAFGAVLSSADEFERAVDEALGRGHSLDPFVVALSGEAERKNSEQWREYVETRYGEGYLGSEETVTLMLGWGDNQSSWNFAASLGKEVETSYWHRKHVWPLPPDTSTEDVEIVASKYLAAHRPDAAIHVVEPAADRVSGDLILKILDDAIEFFNSATSPTRHTMLFEVQDIFQKLTRREDIPLLEIGKREYAYLPLLTHRDGSLVLSRLMAEHPEFFVSVLCDVFKPASGDATEKDERTRNRAQRGYELLTKFEVLPGSDGKDVDQVALYRWVERVRELAAKADRAKVGDVYVGQALAHAPKDRVDGAWPHRAVRDLLETIQSNDVEHGIQVARTNLLGGRFIDPKNPAADERRLAEEARAWAKTTLDWPRTSAMLKELAQSWDASAGRMEEYHRQEHMRTD
jgi:hypothetical protein